MKETISDQSIVFGFLQIYSDLDQVLFGYGSEAETGLAQLFRKWVSALRQTAELASGRL